MTKQVYTLETIAAEKKKIRALLVESKERMDSQAGALFSPPAAANKMQRWTNNLERAFALYDGVMTGYKLFRTFRGLFRRGKKH